MKQLFGGIAAIVAIAAVGLQGQEAGGNVVERLDPALDAIVSVDAKPGTASRPAVSSTTGGWRSLPSGRMGSRSTAKVAW